MKKSDKLNSVLRYTGNLEDQAARAFGASKQRVAEETRKLEELTQYRQEYLSRLEQVGKAGLAVGDLRNYQNFLGRLDTAIEQQRNVLVRSNQEMARRLQDWQARYGKNTAVTRLQEKHRQAEDLHEQKREQKEIDNRLPRRTP